MKFLEFLAQNKLHFQKKETKRNFLKILTTKKFEL